MVSNDSTSIAWLYLRLSRDHYGAADSLANQERILRDHAAAEGLAVEAVYSEGAGRSAYNGKERPEWERLLADVRPGVVVMAVETSRFSRDTEDGLRQLRRIREAGGYVLTTRDGTDTRTTPEGADLPLTIRLAVAEYESAEKSRRIRDRKAGQRLEGKWLNRPPYGHRLAPSGRLELDPETSPHLRHLVELALEGLGGTAIARRLNAEGVPSPGAKPWSQMTVSALLRNPVLVGWMPHKGETFTGPDGRPIRCVDGPTVMTEGERGRIQTMTRERTRLLPSGRRSGKGRATAAILGEVLRCGRCGARMTPRGPMYVCYAASLRGTCEGLTVQRHLVEPEVLRRMTSHLAALDPEDATDLEALDGIARQWMVTASDVDADERAREAAGKLEGARDRLARLEEAHYVTGTMDADRFEELAAAVRGQIETLTAAAGARAGAPDIGPLLDLAQSREAVEAASPEVLRSLVSAVIESATLEPAPYKGARFDPARLAIAWRAPQTVDA